MSMKDVITNCAAAAGQLPIDCEADIDGSCLLKVTLDCFGQMITEAAKASAVQIGGGEKPFSDDFKSLVPYLTAYNIESVDDQTLIPAGLSQSEHTKSKPFGDNVKLGLVLKPKGIIALNKELKKYQKQL